MSGDVRNVMAAVHATYILEFYIAVSVTRREGGKGPRTPKGTIRIMGTMNLT